MILSKAVTFASILLAMLSAVSALPGIIRERHVIHAPIKIKTIHHYRLKKVPVIIRKHLHFYKPREEVHLKPVLEEHHPGQGFHEEEEEDGGGLYAHHEFRPHPKGLPKGSPKGPPKHESSEDSHEAPEEDYEGPSHSREEEYENYEYE